MIVLLLLVGAGWDLWRLSRPESPSAPGPQAGPADSSSRPGSRSMPPALPIAPLESLETPPQRVDLNRASAAELDRLPGIGPVLAARIVAYREQHGPFRTSQELLAVRGIGPRLYARLLPRIEAPSAPRR